MTGPRIGGQVGHGDGEASAIAYGAADVVEPRSLGGPVRGVDQRRAATGEVFTCRVVAQVSGDVRVDTAAHRVVKVSIPGATADGHRDNGPVWVTGGADAGGRRGQRCGRHRGERREGH